MMEALVAAHKAYETAVEEDVAYQDARFILPEGSTNFILCEYPLRTFIDTYAYRACSMFQWEIVQVFREMKRVLVEAHNWMEPYVKISCEQTHGALDEPSEAEFNKMSPQEQSGIAADHEMGAFDHHCTYQGHEKVYPQCEFEWARESNRSFKSKQHEIGAK
jgi:thymidylate synthase ThyX